MAFSVGEELVGLLTAAGVSVGMTTSAPSSPVTGGTAGAGGVSIVRAILRTFRTYLGEGSSSYVF